MNKYLNNIFNFIRKNPILEILTCGSLIIQTFIIYNQISPTEDQAAAAKFEQAEKARERLDNVIEIKNKFSDITEIFKDGFKGDIYCNRECSNIQLEVLYPFLKSEVFLDIDEFTFYENAMRLSRNSVKGASDLYSAYATFNLRLKNILSQDQGSFLSMASELRNIIRKAKIDCRLDSDTFNKLSTYASKIEPWTKEDNYYGSKTLDGLIKEIMFSYYVRNINNNFESRSEFSKLTLQTFRNSIQSVALEFSNLTNRVAEKCDQQVRRYESELQKFD